MVDKQPTQEQIKEFWEWCGFKFYDKPIKNFDGKVLYTVPWYEAPDGDNDSIYELPYPDLNNLFLYAMPKLKETIDYPSLCGLLERWIDIVENTDSDPALALFWAIYSIIREKK